MTVRTARRRGTELPREDSHEPEKKAAVGKPDTANRHCSRDGRPAPTTVQRMNDPVNSVPLSSEAGERQTSSHGISCTSPLWARATPLHLQDVRRGGRPRSNEACQANMHDVLARRETGSRAASQRKSRSRTASGRFDRTHRDIETGAVGGEDPRGKRIASRYQAGHHDSALLETVTDAKVVDRQPRSDRCGSPGALFTAGQPRG